MARDFEIVDDERRRPGRRSSPLLDALRAGKTVFVPGGNRVALGGFYSHLKRQGYAMRVRTEHDPEGLLVWADKVEP